ncbi:hypothetical protein HPB51_024326 [Rhipicephalus microplus]|uniref:DDE Tnp4 domain-containing protein n=1 Tax=Rhipicephalus microplus TaxID=6941 RepID=A0A9J6DY11_RHIMP|nr:hypothetical protein HPB51_024326 [Rhipicephalus microplus]
MLAIPGLEIRASGDQALAVSPATPPIAAKMAAAKANFAALAKLVADVLVSDEDDGEMSDLQSEEEQGETSDLAVAAVLVAQISRKTDTGCGCVEAGLPDVIGAIEGCHVRITRPTACEEDYYNRKKFHSIILQAVCDADMVFPDVFVGFPDRAHDAKVLEESFLFEEAASRSDGLVFFKESQNFWSRPQVTFAQLAGLSKLGRHLTGQHLAAFVAYERKQMRH